MTPEEQATLDQMSVAQQIEEYRRRAGELTPTELSKAVNLIRKARTSTAIARTTARSSSKAKSGASVDEMFAGLDALSKGAGNAP